MKNTQQGSVTIPLEEYNRLKLIEQAIYERKSVWLDHKYGIYLISEEDSNRILFDKIAQLTKDLEEVQEYKNKMFMDKFNKRNRLVFW